MTDAIGTAALVSGTLSAGWLASMLAASILVPRHRLWPIERLTIGNQLSIWLPTILVFVASFILGVLDWNALGWPAFLRWGVGGTLVLLGNLVVWTAFFRLGPARTSGAAGALETGGFYRWSRNPQYVADIAILAGWAILCAVPATLPVIGLGISALILAPFAEEPWLRERHGRAFDDYCRKVRRFL
ncbi:MAG: isoprenylcysteine carboxylmethyltransferase family protein [Geminicoccaceae bacterium]|nr:isoprenylcysteine carboxylmethyltransferase family protein [Geminicoccaceae bacterium]